MAFNLSGPTVTKGGYSEILKFPVGDQAIKSVVLDASTVASDASGNRKLVAGTLLKKNGGGTKYQAVTASGDTIKGVLAYDVEFVDATSASDKPAAMFFHEAVFRQDRIVNFGTLGAAARTALPTCRFELPNE